MKAPLLKLVRVLTITQHHSCLCKVYARHLKTLLPNLDTVRIATDPVSPGSFQVRSLCDSGECPLLQAIQVRKIVLRNLDGGGLPLPTRDWASHHPTQMSELVVVLPTDGRRLEKSYPRDFDGYSADEADLDAVGIMFYSEPETLKITVVFYPIWEGEDTEATPVEPEQVCRGVGHEPLVWLDRFALLFCNLQLDSNNRHTVCGLENVEFATAGSFMSIFQQLFPETELSQDKLREIARHELRTFTILDAIWTGRGIGDIEYDNDNPDLITYRTLEEYLADEKGRQGELSAYD
jgi:hypothetical protein